MGDEGDVVDEQLWGQDEDKPQQSKAEEKYEKDAPIQVGLPALCFLTAAPQCSCPQMLPVFAASVALADNTRIQGFVLAVFWTINCCQAAAASGCCLWFPAMSGSSRCCLQVLPISADSPAGACCCCCLQGLPSYCLQGLPSCCLQLLPCCCQSWYVTTLVSCNHAQ